MFYVNPGYIELMNGRVTGKTVVNAGNVYFYNTQRATNLTYDSCKEVWFKCKFVYNKHSTRFYVYADSLKYVGVRIDENGRFIGFNYVDSAYAQTPTMGALISGNEYELLIHAKSDGTTGTIECYIDGEKQYSYSGSDTNLKNTSFSTLLISGENTGTLFRDIIIADFDVTDYHLTPVDIKDYETDFAKQSDGTIKATAMGQYISMHLDTDDLKAKMQKVVENAEIVGVNVGAFNVGYDSAVINSLKSSVNGTDAETIKLVNTNAAGKILLVNPAGSKAWTLSGLKSDIFKLTAEKV